jgi:hypothetical protein
MRKRIPVPEGAAVCWQDRPQPMTAAALTVETVQQDPTSRTEERDRV